jgi:uncharacterized protein with HEPN domain
MSRDEVYLLDILEAARLALEYVRGKAREEFLADVQLQDAVIRRLAIIGEAARRVSDETRAAIPSLPWHQMVGMRNIIVHEYDDVDLDVVWDAVTRDLPPLVADLGERLPPSRPYP